MKAMIKNTLLSIVGISIVLLALAACGSEPAASPAHGGGAVERE